MKIRFLTLVAFASLLSSACTTVQKVNLPVCPDDLKLAERNLDDEVPFDPEKAVYRQSDGTICSGV